MYDARKNEGNINGNLQTNNSLHPFDQTAVEYFFKEGIQMKGKMIELNKDCMFYSESKAIKELEERQKELLLIYRSELFPLSIKISKTFTFYLSLFVGTSNPYP